MADVIVVMKNITEILDHLLMMTLQVVIFLGFIAALKWIWNGINEQDATK